MHPTPHPPSQIFKSLLSLSILKYSKVSSPVNSAGHKQIEIAPAKTNQIHAQLITFLASALGIPPRAQPLSQRDVDRIKRGIASRVSGPSGPSDWAKVFVASEDKEAISEVRHSSLCLALSLNHNGIPLNQNS